MSTDIPGPFRQFIVPIIVYFVVVNWTTKTIVQTSTEPHSSSSNAASKGGFEERKEDSDATKAARNDQTPTQTASSQTGGELNPGTGFTEPSRDGSIPLGSQNNIGVTPNTPSEPGHAIANDTSSLNIQTPSRVSGTVADPVDANSAIDQIISAQTIGDQESMDRAQSLLDSLPKPLPGDVDDAKRLNKLGLKHLRAKSFLTSLGFFANASKDDPSNPLYPSNLGYAEMNAGDLSSAESHLRTSIALDRSRAVAWGDLALTFAKKGDQNRAVSCLLIGYRVSNGKSRPFIESLQENEDASIRQIGSVALAKLKPEQPM
jgi:hypothetical protein